jgi:hypothetical protein
MELFIFLFRCLARGHAMLIPLATLECFYFAHSQPGHPSWLNSRIILHLDPLLHEYWKWTVFSTTELDGWLYLVTAFMFSSDLLKMSSFLHYWNSFYCVNFRSVKFCKLLFFVVTWSNFNSIRCIILKF